MTTAMIRTLDAYTIVPVTGSLLQGSGVTEQGERIVRIRPARCSVCGDRGFVLRLSPKGCA